MDEEKLQEKIDFFSEKCGELNNLEKAKLFEEISVAISNFVQYVNDDNDSKDRIFDKLSEIEDSVQEDFEELIRISSDKKHFVRALTKVFTLLLNTKVDTVNKFKRILKIAIKTRQKIWQEPKQL